MTNYTFSTLNDKDFELLIRDLLSLELGLQLQAFKTGRDKGIDLRYSRPANNNAMVVQVKHYVGSTFPQLKHNLKFEECEKVKKLDPERYIIATSMPLSAIQKDEIKAIFNPLLSD